MKQRTRADKYRLASRLCWLFSMLCTASFVKEALAANYSWDWLALWAVAIVSSSGIQYFITLLESQLFDGVLPPFWQLSTWTQAGSIPWRAGGAIICLAVDVFLNMGGVQIFTTNMKNVSPGLLTLIVIALSLVLAVGSELLDASADAFDGKARKPVVEEHRHDQRKQEEQRHPVTTVRLNGDGSAKHAETRRLEDMRRK